MLGTLIRKVVGSKNERDLKRLQPFSVKINEQEAPLLTLSDSQISNKTNEFRQRLSSGETLENLLPEAFAVVREASKRVLGMRHFDVQLIGGVVLHEGKIVEMKTGEGKTLVATLPVYLNALAGKGVHVVTVNDYLAKRDSQWMGRIYQFLGLTVGLIQNNLGDQERQAAYGCDVTYGTNNEFGFDYLRDNMKFDYQTYVQRELGYAIIDEVDSILIDEARTPLIISGPTEESTDKYYQINQIIPSLQIEKEYTIDEKSKTAALTDEGNAKVERLLKVENLYDVSNISLVHHVLQGLKAHTLFKRDVDYVVKEGEVIIVDEFTGRLMAGRRWSDGLHQAVEAKEGVKIANENQTLASITFQNYFRIYQKLAGMTGTADTEASEFNKIYSLDVMVIPPNKQMIRMDYADVIYKTEKEKFNAIVEEIVDLNKRGQPVLVGTITIEKSEILSTLLKKKGIKHSVLNAKFHEKEAEIIAQAGRFGSITIATNMAGRGTDIILGGSPEALFNKAMEGKEGTTKEKREEELKNIREMCEKEKRDVISAGGLHIVGTERHESRRIDNQLRGRSGRQGDPGSSRFYLSLEDDLLRIFGSERIASVMDRLGMEEGVPIEHRMVTRAIENAQKKVEAHNFDSRKQLLEYDDVMNKQREVIYDQRRQILKGENLKEDVFEMIEEVVEENLASFCDPNVYPEEWDRKGLGESLSHQFSFPFPENVLLDDTGTGLKEKIVQGLREEYDRKEKEFGGSLMRYLEKMILLRVVDGLWKDHLLAMDFLKEGIGLRGYGQKDPLVEYKREGFDLFSEMIHKVKTDVGEQIFRVQMAKEPQGDMGRMVRRPPTLQFNRGEVVKPRTVHREHRKVGRNDPCVCGSGKKYKKCCGK